MEAPAKIPLKAGSMIPLNTLNRQSLFPLLHAVDQEFSNQVKSEGCPIAGGRYILPIIGESLGAALLNYKRFSKFVSVFVVDVQAADAAPCLHRYDLGSIVFIGH